MRLLVTGAEGQVGREIVKHGGTLGHDVIAAGRADLNIADYASVSARFRHIRPDAVINCAAYNNVDGAEADWQTAYMANAIGVRNLANAAREANAMVVHYSTDFVFDGNASSPYTIADTPSPLNRYAKSKLLGERLLRDHCERFFLIRTSWVFGQGKFSFPLKVLGWAAANRKLRVSDDQVSSPSYSVDLAEATLRLVATGNFGLYHMTNSGSASRYEWTAHILKCIGWDGVLERGKSAEFPTPARRPAYSVLDNFPLEHAIGTPMPAWQDATERFLREAASR